MSTPNSYFGSGMHASAVLKADYKRLRAKFPDRYVAVPRKVTEMDGVGRVSVVSVRDDAKATPPTPRQRHVACTSTPRGQ